MSKERVGNSREDAWKLQTRTTVRVVILKEWSTGLCFRIFPCAVKVQVPGSSQGAEDTVLRLQGWLAGPVPRADTGLTQWAQLMGRNKRNTFAQKPTAANITLPNYEMIHLPPNMSYMPVPKES